MVRGRKINLNVLGYDMNRFDVAMGKVRAKLPEQMTPDQMEAFEAWFENLPEEEKAEYSQKIEQAYVAASKKVSPSVNQFEAGETLMKTSKISMWHITDFFRRKRERHERVDEKETRLSRFYRRLKGKILLVRIWIEKKTRPTVEKLSWILVKKLQPDAYFNTPVSSPRHRKRIFARRVGFINDGNKMSQPGYAVQQAVPMTDEEYQRRMETLLLIDAEPDGDEDFIVTQMNHQPVPTPENAEPLDRANALDRLIAFARNLQGRER